jgi:solute carrier family 35 protein
MDPQTEESHRAALLKQVGAAIFYGLSSILIITVNKVVLTSYKFPSPQVVGLGQIIVTIGVLRIAKFAGIVKFPDFGLQSLKQVFPLPLIYFGNLVFGLAGTQKLSLPMFTVLRRSTLLLTLIGEWLLLGTTSSHIVQFSIVIMIVGAVIAALNDLAFNLPGYIFVTINNIFTSSNVLYMKKVLGENDLGKYGILYYNALLMVVPAGLLAFWTGDIEAAYKFDQWKDGLFLTHFLLSCFMGFILMYATVLCTAVNSPLTTTVTGCIKNIAVTYLGMILGGDYVFSAVNFAGVNLSVFGSLVFSGAKYREQVAKVQTQKGTNVNV